MNIDWSKAPEGATHKEVSAGREGYWYKFDFEANTAAYWSALGGHWAEGGKASEYNDGSMDFMISRDRPCTPKAGKERSEACDKMFGVLMNADLHRRGSCISDICEALYDAGYRKCP